MTVSIVIPTYNEEKVIEKCLESLSGQSFNDMEILVVDDGSTDNTLKILSKIKKVKVYKESHKGPGQARNLGAKHARGKILVFVDADMTFDKDFIKNLIKPIINEESKGTFSKEEIVSNWDNVWAKCWNINEGWENGKRHPKNYPDSQKVFRAILKSEFDKVNGFDSGGHYTDDWTLSEKLGYLATSAPGKFYHENPDTLDEVFKQAKWAAKRPYKLGILGNIVALVRASFIVSLIVGFWKTISTKSIKFFIFKMVYDFGTFWGIVSYTLSGKGFK
jgi:glycosyltransferase involved in cell wall biosynthesis